MRNEQLRKNRAREEERKAIVEKYELDKLTPTQREKAISRVLLCREQKFQSAYSDRCISEKLAAEDRGKQLEIDHIIPKSKGGPDGLNNRLLCYAEENRGKGNKTLREWLTEKDYGALEQCLGHLRTENPVKWENLHKDVRDMEEFVESQLTDTAYAAKQVVAWLQSALYGTEEKSGRRVYATKGQYTAIVRRDLGLFADGRNKDRSDHRHHAIDAVAIALSGPETLGELARAYEVWEQAKSKGYNEVKREATRAPWGSRESFREEVMKQYRALVVSHRPVNRKIVGEFHKANPHGVVVIDGEVQKELSTKRIYAVELKAKHLRVPEGWEEWRAKLMSCKTRAEKKDIRRRMLALEDCKPGKSGIVRDRWLREEIRTWLRNQGLDPDDISEKAVKTLVREKGLRLASGVPVRRLTLLMADTTVPINRWHWNAADARMEREINQRAVRLYQPQSNHHIEIRVDRKGRWRGEVVRTYDVALRKCAYLRALKEAGVPSGKTLRGMSKEDREKYGQIASEICKAHLLVDRRDRDGEEFVMSLAIGEMVYARHPTTGTADCFVVFKIDGSGTIHFTPHYDAGKSKGDEMVPAREDIALSAAQLQALGVQGESGPRKIRVSALGEITFLKND